MLKKPAAFFKRDLPPFPGAKQTKPIHYGHSKSYTDAKNKRWRLYKELGDKVENSYFYNKKQPSMVWAELIRELRACNLLSAHLKLFKCIKLMPSLEMQGLARILFSAP